MAEDEDTKDPIAVVQKTPSPGRRLRRWLFCARAVLVVCLAPVIFAAAAAVMVVDRDISAPTWLKTRIEARAADVLDGGQLRFGGISLRIGRDLHPTVRLRDTVLIDQGGVVITRIPLVEGLISPRGLVFQQDVLMQEVRLIGAQVNLRRAADGSVAVALAAGAGDVGQAGSLPELLDQVDEVFERPALEALEIVRADGLVVNFDDARAGRSWIVDGGTVVLDLKGDETALRGDFALLSGRADVTTVNLSYSSPRGSRAAKLALNITDAVASDIAAQSPALSWLRDVEAPISAALRTTLDDAGALGLLNASLEIGQGVLQPNPATEPVTFDQAKAYLTYDPVRDSIAFSEVDVQTEWGAFNANGTAYLRDIQDGLPRALLAQFAFEDVVLNPPGFFETPPLVPAAVADLRIRFDPFEVEVGQLVVTDGPTRVITRGSMAATDAGWRVALDAEASEITPEKVLGFWPVGVKPRTRSWVSNNLIEANLFNVTAGFRVEPGVRTKIATGFEFADATVRFLRDMPPITQGAGVLTIMNDSLVIAVDEGTVAAPQGGPLQLAGSVFSIPDLGVKPAAPAVVTLETDSSITAVMSILNQPPFEFIDKVNLPVTLADGRAGVSGTVGWPLGSKVGYDQVAIEMAAELRNVRSDLITGRNLAAPQLRVSVDNSGLTLAGVVNIDGAVADAVWSRPFGAGGDSQLQAEMALSAQSLDALNIKLPPGTIAGEGTGQLTIELKADVPPAFTLGSDLRGLTVAIPALGWSKAPNASGALLIEGILGDVPVISNLEIEGGGLQAQGRINVVAGGGLESAVFSRVRVGDWLNAPVTLRGRGSGQPVAVEIRGGQLDLRRARLGGGGQSESGPMVIALDRLQVTQGIALTGFEGNFNGSGGFSGQFSARMNGEAAVTGTVAPRNGRSAVRLRSENAGGVLRASGFMRNATGGVLDLTLLPTGNAGQFDGTLGVRGIRVQDAPTIAALLDAISVVGLLQQLDGQGLSFEEVDATFRLTPDQVIVSQASAVGPGLGISVDGIYTLASKQVDLQGVVSPFFLVNSIGSFLTRKGEGLIGFNFNIGGTAAAPQVSVNPLSALTPGMFREIFRRPAPELSQ